MGCASLSTKKWREEAAAVVLAANTNLKQGDEKKKKINKSVIQKTNPYMKGALTNKDLFHLKMSWRAIEHSLEVTGVAMFIK